MFHITVHYIHLNWCWQSWNCSEGCMSFPPSGLHPLLLWWTL